jgi:hypothetical protein
MALSAGIFFVGLRQLLSLFPSIVQAYPTKKIAAAGALVALTTYYMISGLIGGACIHHDGDHARRGVLRSPVDKLARHCLVRVGDPTPVTIRGPGPELPDVVCGDACPGPRLRDLVKKAAARTSLAAGRRSKARRFHHIIRLYGGILLTSMIGGFSTALFAVEHFHRLSAYGLPANLMAMPVISFVVMPMGMLAMLLTPFGLDVIPWKIAGFGLDIVIAIAQMVSAWGGNIDIGRLPGWYFPVAVAGFLLLALLRTKIRYLGAGIAGAGNSACCGCAERNAARHRHCRRRQSRRDCERTSPCTEPAASA